MAARKKSPRKKTRGEKVCAFIETYCLAPEGDHIGQPIVLEPFQRKFILQIYDNPVGTHSAYLSIARKTGKTALLAGMLLAQLCGPEAIQNSQIVSGAQSKDQAAVVFELARKMVEMNPALAARVRIQPSGKRLIGLSKNVLYRALSAEGKTAHGLSLILAILDEVGPLPTTSQLASATPCSRAQDEKLIGPTLVCMITCLGFAAS